MARVQNYINNKSLYEALIEHRKKLNEAETQLTPKPNVSRYIGEAINLINDNLVKKGNFSGYSTQWKQEMTSDGKLDCIAAVDNFDPERTNNPFAYFTQIAWHAFIRRIHKEKRQTYIKHKNFENSFLMNNIWDESENIHLKSNEYSSEIVKSFEEKLTKPEKKTKIKGVEKIQENLDEK